ncbi:porin [Buchnera aphidicola]|uniref:porin n=1 Tax=Buchnera aphidicola TaxID=9 RepID=UPI003463DDF4
MSIKKIIVMVFAVLCSINVAHGITIYNDNNLTIKTHVKVNQNKQYACNIKNGKKNYRIYNRFLSCVFFGTKQDSEDIISYFTLGYDFNNSNILVNHYKVNSNTMTPLVFGYCINHIGNIEFGRDYNLIHDLNNITKRFVYKDMNSKLNIYRDLMYHMHKTATYKNHGFFGLIDNLTIASQYQKIKSNSYYHPQEIINNLIQYDFKSIGMSISGVYLTNLNNYLNPNQFNYKENITKSYALSMKYSVHHVYIAAFYSSSNHIKPSFNNMVLLNNVQHLEYFAEYQLFSKWFISIGYLNINCKKLLCQQHNNSITHMYRFHTHQFLNSLHQFNISLKYHINQYSVLYFNNRTNFFNMNPIKLSSIKNIIEGGIFYYF